MKPAQVCMHGPGHNSSQTHNHSLTVSLVLTQPGWPLHLASPCGPAPNRAGSTNIEKHSSGFRSTGGYLEVKPRKPFTPDSRPPDPAFGGWGRIQSGPSGAHPTPKERLTTTTLICFNSAPEKFETGPYFKPHSQIHTPGRGWKASPTPIRASPKELSLQTSMQSYFNSLGKALSQGTG